MKILALTDSSSNNFHSLTTSTDSRVQLFWWHLGAYFKMRWITLQTPLTVTNTTPLILKGAKTSTLMCIHANWHPKNLGRMNRSPDFYLYVLSGYRSHPVYRFLLFLRNSIQYKLDNLTQLHFDRLLGTLLDLEKSLWSHGITNVQYEFELPVWERSGASTLLTEPHWALALGWILNLCDLGNQKVPRVSSLSLNFVQYNNEYE